MGEEKKIINLRDQSFDKCGGLMKSKSVFGSFKDHMKQIPSQLAAKYKGHQVHIWGSSGQ